MPGLRQVEVSFQLGQKAGEQQNRAFQPGEHFSIGQNPRNSVGISSGRWGHFQTGQEGRNVSHTGVKVLQGHLIPGWGTVLELLAGWKSWILWDQAETSCQAGQQLLPDPKATVLYFQSHLSC